MKSVLVQINRDSGHEARLQAALDVVRAFDGHLTCMQVTSLETFASLDPYGVGYMLAETITFMRDVEEKEKKACEEALQNEGVNWDWIVESGDAARMLGDHSWLSDLVVVSAPADDWKPRLEAPPTAADVVVRSRAPVLVVPPESRGLDCRGPAVIAWNGSPESCSAIRAALPLLRKASAVHLIHAGSEEGFDLPSTDASTYLARHGIASELVEIEPGRAPICETLLDAAEARKASYLVTGAFGHSRLRENILGGVTKGLLQKAKLPLVLAH